jgi:hypothetical protein
MKPGIALGVELPFTHKPGRRERHLKRRHLNPLFAWPPMMIEPERLLAAQKADHEEMESFQDSFRALVQRAIDLPPETGSDILLTLKASLEQHYEQSFGLPEDHQRERDALGKLIELIMRAIARAAGNDPLAQREMADEQTARATHFRLLEQPLVADLLHPESPIAADELTPTLLSASLPELAAALELFDADQVALIAQEAGRLADRTRDHAIDATALDQRLALIRSRLASS